MNVASLDLCRELYELSGWRDAPFVWLKGGKSILWSSFNDYNNDEAPAYDLGYLLRKLPLSFTHKHVVYYLTFGEGFDALYQFDYRSMNEGQFCAIVDDEPENCLARLAIELFQQGILQKEVI